MLFRTIQSSISAQIALNPSFEVKKVECTGCGSRERLDGLDKGVFVTIKAPGCNKLMTMSTKVIKKALNICFDETVDILHLDSEKLMDMLLDVEKVQITVNHMNNEIQDVVKQRENESEMKD